MAPRSARAVAAANQEKKLTRQVPTESEVTKWIEHAKGLPRMLEYRIEKAGQCPAFCYCHVAGRSNDRRLHRRCGRLRIKGIGCGHPAHAVGIIYTRRAVAAFPIE